MSYFGRIFNACSQLANVVLLNGEPNESISSRSYREPWPRAMKIINAIFFWQNHHCRGAYNAEREWARRYLNQR